MSRTAVVRENVLYSSVQSNEFDVILDKDTAERLGCNEETVILEVSPQNVKIKSTADFGRVYTTWPIRYLRRYGKRSRIDFYFEAGRRCESGPGMFLLRTSKSDEVLALMDEFTAVLASSHPHTTTAPAMTPEDTNRTFQEPPQQAPTLPARQNSFRSADHPNHHNLRQQQASSRQQNQYQTQVQNRIPPSQHQWQQQQKQRTTPTQLEHRQQHGVPTPRPPEQQQQRNSPAHQYHQQRHVSPTQRPEVPIQQRTTPTQQDQRAPAEPDHPRAGGGYRTPSRTTPTAGDAGHDVPSLYHYGPVQASTVSGRTPRSAYGPASPESADKLTTAPQLYDSMLYDEPLAHDAVEAVPIAEIDAGGLSYHRHGPPHASAEAVVVDDGDDGDAEGDSGDTGSDATHRGGGWDAYSTPILTVQPPVDNSYRTLDPRMMVTPVAPHANASDYDSLGDLKRTNARPAETDTHIGADTRAVLEKRVPVVSQYTDDYISVMQQQHHRSGRDNVPAARTPYQNDHIGMHQPHLLPQHDNQGILPTSVYTQHTLPHPRRSSNAAENAYGSTSAPSSDIPRGRGEYGRTPASAATTGRTLYDNAMYGVDSNSPTPSENSVFFTDDMGPPVDEICRHASMGSMGSAGSRLSAAAMGYGTLGEMQQGMADVTMESDGTGDADV